MNDTTTAETAHSFRAYFEKAPLGALLLGISSGFPFAMIAATDTSHHHRRRNRA